MLVLHLGFREETFLFWGETPPARPFGPLSADGGAAVSSLEKYPFGAGRARLLAMLTEFGIDSHVEGPRSKRMAVWLPTVAGVPVASTSLVAEPPAKRGKPVLAPWRITAIRLAPGDAIDLMCACAAGRTPAPGLTVAPDMAFWVEAMRFAGALVARQRYLPGVSHENGVFHALWQPIFTGEDSRRLAKLAEAMPPSCRALTSPASPPPEIPASAILQSFIGRLVDHVVRDSLPGKYAPAVRGARAGRTRRSGSAFPSVHDQWLSALGSPDGSMHGDQEKLEEFAGQVREWRLPLATAAISPFRLCFRLEEPEDGDGEASKPGQRGEKLPQEGSAWHVRYLLQAVDDQSLLIPAEYAWETRGKKKSLLERDGFDAREYLLVSLGQASRLCPRTEESLKSPAPCGYETDARGAHEFLSESALELEQAGFVVMFPAWWTPKGARARLGVRAKVKSPQMTGGGLTLDRIAQFDWEVALGDEKMSITELRALAKMKAPLVRVRGQWIQVNADDIRAALDLLEKKQPESATVHDVIRMALGGAADTPGDMPFEGLVADGWVADLLENLEGRSTFEQLEAPAGFGGILRPYQSRGYSWLSFLGRCGLGACLADDMGLGKTIQVLALAQREWRMGNRRPVLVICPTSVVSNWHKEAQRFTPDLPVMVHHGAERMKAEKFRREADACAIVVSSYGLLRRDLKTLCQVEWSGVVLDEAQNIKNPETKQAKAAQTLAGGFRIALTGTPVENTIGDLWSIMEFLNPGFLGTRGEFKKKFFIPIQANLDPEASDRLKRLTGPFILRRLKTDRSIISDLPNKMEMKVFCNLTREQASLYAAVAEEAMRTLEESEGIERRGIVLATLVKLKQVCNHPRQLLRDNSAIAGRSGKLARLTEMLEEAMIEGDRALVFSQFAQMGEILKTHLEDTFGREVLFLHGAVARGKRERMIERFQSEEDGPRVFLLSLKAGGTGLNLTRASHVFHFDRWWNPAVEDQATDRAFRIGQKKNVQVHKFLCAGTLEEKIDEMIERKKGVAELVVGTGEKWLTELSNSQLKELITLETDATVE